MATPIDATIAQLKACGLQVTARNPSTLFIAARVVDHANGISISNDATILMDQGAKWHAIFPAQGQCTFELSGTLEELTVLVLSVYRDYQSNGGQLYEAFMRVVPAHQPFLHGASSPPSLAEAKSA